MKLQLRWAAGRAHHFDTAPQNAARMPGTECFHRRLLGSETAGQMGGRVATPCGVGDFTVRENSQKKFFAVSCQSGRYAVDFSGIQSNADNIHMARYPGIV